MRKIHLDEIDVPLYFIADSHCTKGSAVEDIQVALEAGIKIVQYRNKTGSKEEYLNQGKIIRELCRTKEALFIVNDRLDAAMTLDADGLHIGQDDIPLEIVRNKWPNRLIGLSTHNPHQVKVANRLRPDYIGFGPIFPTVTKKNPEPSVGLEQLRNIRRLTDLPIVAIGGIHLGNAAMAMDSGANMVAAISDTVGSSNLKGQILKYIRILGTQEVKK